MRRAGALHLVPPRAVWKQVGIGVGDTVEIQCRNGRVVIALDAGKEFPGDGVGPTQYRVAADICAFRTAQSKQYGQQYSLDVAPRQHDSYWALRFADVARRR